MFFGGSKGKNKDEGVRVTPDELRELEAFIAALRQRDFESEAPEFTDPRLRDLSAVLGDLLRAHANEYLKMTQDINDVLLSATKASESPRRTPTATRPSPRRGTRRPRS